MRVIYQRFQSSTTVSTFFRPDEASPVETRRIEKLYNLTTPLGPCWLIFSFLAPPPRSQGVRKSPVLHYIGCHLFGVVPPVDLVEFVCFWFMGWTGNIQCSSQ